MSRKQIALTPARISFFDRPREAAPSRVSSVQNVQVDVPPCLKAALSNEDKTRIKEELSKKLSDLQGRLHVSRYSPMRSNPMLVIEAHHLLQEGSDINKRLGDRTGSDIVGNHSDSAYVEARRMSSMITVIMLSLKE